MLLTAHRPWGAAVKQVGLIITMLVQKGRLSGWPDLLPTLLQLISSEDQNVCEGAGAGIQRVGIRDNSSRPGDLLCEIGLQHGQAFRSCTLADPNQSARRSQGRLCLPSPPPPGGGSDVGSFWTLHKICEDNQEEMRQPTTAPVVDMMLPTLINYFEHGNPKVVASLRDKTVRALKSIVSERNWTPKLAYQANGHGMLVLLELCGPVFNNACPYAWHEQTIAGFCR